MRTELGILVAPAVALALLGGAAGAAQDPTARGTLRVAVYADFAPFSAGEQGVDVDVARAVAGKLGLDVDVFGFTDADDVDGDLRNVVWKGHYLRKERLADVMMHVPVDPVLIERNQQVRILAPYYREQLVVARNPNRLPELPTLQAFGSERIAVQFATVEDHYLLSSFGGLMRENVVHFGTLDDAAAALRRNEVAAVMGRRSHLEAALAGASAGYRIAPVATPGLAVTGWDVGLAVRADDADLAARIERAMAELRADGTLERIFRGRGLSWAAPRSAP